MAPTIIGKPARYLFDSALQKLSCNPSDTAVVGDRLETDIYGGKQVGLWTILITTGVDNEKTIKEKKIQPDWIINSLFDLMDFLRGAH